MGSLTINLSYRVISRLPFDTTRRLAKRPLLLPIYHLVSDDEVAHIKHLYRHRSIAEFTRDLDFLLAHYKPVGLAEVLAHLGNGAALPENSFHLTFDDGLREIYEPIAPLLERKGVPATFFLTTDYLDNKSLGLPHERGLLLHALESKADRAEKVVSALRARGIRCDDAAQGLRRVRYDQRAVLREVAPLLDVDFDEYLARRKPFVTSQQVESLIKRGFSIGAHSIDHPLYALLSLQEQLRQTTQSMNSVARRFGLTYRVFAFPFSDMGVSKTFFEEIYRNKILDASFGASGLLSDVHPRNLQRLWLEYNDLSAEERIRRVRGLLGADAERSRDGAALGMSRARRQSHKEMVERASRPPFN